MIAERQVIPIERLERAILLIRGRRVMLDADLAQIYGVAIKRLNEQVRRNIERFPDDFMFRLTPAELADVRSHVTLPEGGRPASGPLSLRSQNATLDSGRGRHSKYLPCAFTEQGVAMLSTVLRSRRAVMVNISIMRAFVHLRGLASCHGEMSQKLAEMEERYDARFKIVFDAIRVLMDPPVEPGEPIGFRDGGVIEYGRAAV